MKQDNPFIIPHVAPFRKSRARNMTRLTGNMDSEKIISFCREHDIRLIIDAAHPFAQQLHLNIFLAAKELTIKVVRLERIYPKLSEEIIWCDDFEDAVARMKQDGIEKLLALTGTQTIAKLQGFWKEHGCIFRVLERSESVDIAIKAGFPKEKLIFYQPEEDESLLFKQLSRKRLSRKKAAVREASPKK